MGVFEEPLILSLVVNMLNILQIQVLNVQEVGEHIFD